MYAGKSNQFVYDIHSLACLYNIKYGMWILWFFISLISYYYSFPVNNSIVVIVIYTTICYFLNRIFDRDIHDIIQRWNYMVNSSNWSRHQAALKLSNYYADKNFMNL